MRLTRLLDKLRDLYDWLGSESGTLTAVWLLFLVLLLLVFGFVGEVVALVAAFVVALSSSASKRQP